MNYISTFHQLGHQHSGACQQGSKGKGCISDSCPVESTETSLQLPLAQHLCSCVSRVILVYPSYKGRHVSCGKTKHENVCLLHLDDRGEFPGQLPNLRS